MIVVIRVLLMIAAINSFIAAHAHSEPSADAVVQAFFGCVCVGLFVELGR